MLFETIPSGQWWAYRFRPYMPWVHRLFRAIDREIEIVNRQTVGQSGRGRGPGAAGGGPWPGPTNDHEATVRAMNPSLFRGPRPKKRAGGYRTSYLPRSGDDSRAVIEVFSPGPGEDFLWRIRIRFTDGKPWEVEALVDAGDRVFGPFFREVRVRLPLKASVRGPVVARGGVWEGAGPGVRKLNELPGVRAQLDETLGGGGKRLAERTTPAASGPPLPRQGGEPFGAEAAGFGCQVPGAGGRKESRNGTNKKDTNRHEGAAGFSTGYRLPATDYRTSTSGSDLPATVFGPRAQGFRLPSTGYRLPATDYRPSNDGGITLGLPAQVDWYYRVPEYLDDTVHDGFAARRAEVGPDPAAWWRWPPRRGRKPVRRATARQRWGAVVPSVCIEPDPDGRRQSELAVVLRPGSAGLGVGQALALARLAEAAIKYRQPPKPGRKPSWRQQLRHRVMFRPGLLTQMVRAAGAAGDGGQVPGAGGKRLTERTTPAASGPPLLRQGWELGAEAAGAKAAEAGAGGRRLGVGVKRKRAGRLSTGYQLPATDYPRTATDYEPPVLWLRIFGYRVGIPPQFVPKPRHVPQAVSGFS